MRIRGDNLHKRDHEQGWLRTEPHCKIRILILIFLVQKKVSLRGTKI